jgi:hypothetical protein
MSGEISELWMTYSSGDNNNNKTNLQTNLKQNNQKTLWNSSCCFLHLQNFQISSIPLHILSLYLMPTICGTCLPFYISKSRNWSFLTLNKENLWLWASVPHIRSKSSFETIFFVCFVLLCYTTRSFLMRISYYII